MFLKHLLIAALVAIIFSAILASLFRWRRPGRPEAGIGGAILFLFFLLILPVWALGAWMVPFGPMIYGTPWIGFGIVGLILTLLILLLAPVKDHNPPPRTGEGQVEEEMARQAEEETASGMAVFLIWVFAVVAVAVAISAYVG